MGDMGKCEHAITLAVDRSSDRKRFHQHAFGGHNLLDCEPDAAEVHQSQDANHLIVPIPSGAKDLGERAGRPWNIANGALCAGDRGEDTGPFPAAPIAGRHAFAFASVARVSSRSLVAAWAQAISASTDARTPRSGTFRPAVRALDRHFPTANASPALCRSVTMRANTLARWAQSQMPPADRNASASVAWTACGDATPGIEPRGRP